MAAANLYRIVNSNTIHHWEPEHSVPVANAYCGGSWAVGVKAVALAVVFGNNHVANAFGNFAKLTAGNGRNAVVARHPDIASPVL